MEDEFYIYVYFIWFFSDDNLVKFIMKIDNMVEKSSFL